MTRGRSFQVPAITVCTFLMTVILASGMLTGVALAVPACPGGAQVTQPNGTRITVFLKGDENAHWNETGDGYLIERDEPTGLWFYVNDNSIPATAAAVGAADPLAVGAVTAEQKGIAMQAAEARNARLLLQGRHTLRQPARCTTWWCWSIFPTWQ